MSEYFHSNLHKNLKLPSKDLKIDTWILIKQNLNNFFTLLQQFCYFLKIKLTDFASIFCSNWQKYLELSAKGRNKEIRLFIGGRGSE